MDFENTDTVKSATAAVIWDKGKVLLALRSKDDFWEFPGGKIDPGETPEECIVREIKEELNIEIEVKKSLGVIEGFFRRRQMTLFVYEASRPNGEIQLNVHRDICWIDPSELHTFSIIHEDQKIREIILTQNKEAGNG